MTRAGTKYYIFKRYNKDDDAKDANAIVMLMKSMVMISMTTMMMMVMMMMVKVGQHHSRQPIC